MVKEKTIFQREIEKNPEQTQQDLKALDFVYNMRLGGIIAKTCEFTSGKEGRDCLKRNSDLVRKVYSLKDFFSDNFKLRDGKNTLNKSIEILKNIFNQK